MIIYASESQWLRFSGGVVTRETAFPKLVGPAVVVWHSQRGIAGVAALEGKVRHAAVLIERRLRTEGSIEGEVKVFIHHVRQIGEGYQALYTAAPLGEWQRLLVWANAQAHHCLVHLSTALLWNGQKPGSAVVFHNGTQITFLGMLGGQITQINAIALSASPDDLHFAVGTLGEQVREKMAGLKLDKIEAALEVRWLSMCYEAPRDLSASLHAVFGGISRLRVSSQNERFENTDTNSGSYSAIPLLARQAGVGLALNTGADKWLFLADRFLPVCAMASFAVAFSLLVVGMGWFAQSWQTSQKIATLQQRETQARDRIASLEGLKKMPAHFMEQMAFIDTMQKLESGHDLTGLLQALKAASPAELHILGLRTEGAVAGKSLPQRMGAEGAALPKFGSVVVDGLLNGNATSQDSKLLSSFVRALRERGYQAEPVDTKSSAAALSMSSRLFSYRLTRVNDRSEVRQ